MFISLRFSSRLADAGEVAVPLDEPGDRELSLQVDDLRVRTDVALDVGRAANGGDPVAGDGDRLGLGLRGLDGHNLAVEQDHVGGHAGGLLTSGARGHGCEPGHHYCEHQHEEH